MKLGKKQEKLNKIKAIHELLRIKIRSKDNLMALKRKLSRKHGIKLLSNSEILAVMRNNILREKSAGAIHELPLQRILRRRAVRTLSGVAPVAVLTESYPCPGKCVYCPSEAKMPKSYLSNEPAVMRAIACGFDPYEQVRSRLTVLEAIGHEPTKIELIVIGGTWSVLPAGYKYWYIKECFRAANNYESRSMNNELWKKRKTHDSLFMIHVSLNYLKADLLKEQKRNEIAKYRIIGLTLETRPDYINEKELLEMRELGCTRVELGVQAIDDQILKLNRRGHGVDATWRATKMLKDYGFKVTYHIMPGLPGSTAKKDIAMFKKLFTDQRFQPDQIKFYPTVVTRGSLLYKWWLKGKYKPYADKVLENLIIDCKKIVPPYVRIIRLIRDIPRESIVAGNMITNLRQIMKDRGIECKCVRCREARNEKFSIFNFQFSIIEYKASGGREFFLCCESKNGTVLYGFCRLRLINKTPLVTLYKGDKKPLPPFQKGGRGVSALTGAIIRELHVYGELVPVGSGKKVQHAGLGKMLMKKAEEIARKNGFKKIAVISGVGVRGYYRKLGYKLKNSYMVKNLV